MLRDLGSPAHAGIDRRYHRRLFDQPGFPRTRGDRPLYELSDGPAGVRFPRTRGDRPHLGKPALSADLVPPHTRG